jgi:predicted transcriptional regulator
MARSGNRSRGDLERDVLACLAAAGRPMTATEVQSELGGQLAYTTVMTTLSRLFEKRALNRELRGRAFSYTLSGGTAGALSNVTAHRMHRLLEAGQDRAGVLARFVADLSPEDERLLAELLSRPEEEQ